MSEITELAVGPLPEGSSVVGIEQAEAFLFEKFGESVSNVVQVSGGAWSKAYMFQRDGVDFVLRFGGFVDDFEKDRLAQRFASPELPIPAVVEIGQAVGGYFAISERAFGSFIDHLDGEQMRALLPSLFAMLDAARLVDLSETTGWGGWDANGNGFDATCEASLLGIADEGDAEGRGGGWRQRLESSATGAGRFDEAFGYLKELVAFCPEERHLIHSDLLHFNVLVEGDRISAVFDWGCSRYGDFLYDVAWFAFWAPWYPAWREIDFAAEAARHYAAIGLDVPHFAERLRCCMVHIGLDGQRYQAFVGDWEELERTAERTLLVARGEP